MAATSVQPRYSVPPEQCGIQVHAHGNATPYIAFPPLETKTECLFKDVRLVWHMNEATIKDAGRQLESGTVYCGIRPLRLADNVDTELLGRYTKNYQCYLYYILGTGHACEWAFFDTETAVRRFCNLIGDAVEQPCFHCMKWNPAKQYKATVDESHLTIHVLRGWCSHCWDCLRSTHKGPVVEHATHLDWYNSVPDKKAWVVLRNGRWFGSRQEDAIAHYGDVKWAAEELDPAYFSRFQAPAEADNPELYAARPKWVSFEIFVFDSEEDAARHANRLDEYERKRLRRMKRTKPSGQEALTDDDSDSSSDGQLSDDATCKRKPASDCCVQ